MNGGKCLCIDMEMAMMTMLARTEGLTKKSICDVAGLMGRSCWAQEAWSSVLLTYQAETHGFYLIYPGRSGCSFSLSCYTRDFAPNLVPNALDQRLEVAVALHAVVVPAAVHIANAPGLAVADELPIPLAVVNLDNVLHARAARPLAGMLDPVVATADVELLVAEVPLLVVHGEELALAPALVAARVDAHVVVVATRAAEEAEMVLVAGDEAGGAVGGGQALVIVEILVVVPPVVIWAERSVDVLRLREAIADRILEELTQLVLVDDS